MISGLFNKLNLRGRGYLLLPLITAVVVGFAFQGSRSLYGTSEGRYAECGREMLESGNWLEPTLGYRPHWSKPPLTYWCVAGGLKLLGNNEWGARLFNSFAFVFTVLAVSGIGRLLYDRRTGTLAGFIYSTSLLPVLGAFTITTDMLLTMWVAVAVYFYLRAWRAAAAGERCFGPVVLFWAALGMGFFTKGPPALLVLLPITVFNLSLSHRPRLLNPVGIPLFLLLALWWFAAVIRLHPDLWHYYIGTELVERVASKSVHNHAFYKAFKIYPPAFIGGAGLWLLLVIYLAVRLQLYLPATVRRYWRQSVSVRFLLLWLLLPLAVFMLSSSKLHLYVLPIFAPVCIALAAGVARPAPLRPAERRALVILSVAAFMMVFAVKMLAPLKKTTRNTRQVFEMCAKYIGPGTVFAVVDHKSWDIMFYLQGECVSLSLSGKEFWDNGALTPVLDALKSGRLPGDPVQPLRYCALGITPPPVKRIVFIRPLWKKTGSDLCGDASASFRCSCESNGFWEVCGVSRE